MFGDKFLCGRVSPEKTSRMLLIQTLSYTSRTCNLPNILNRILRTFSREFLPQQIVGKGTSYVGGNTYASSTLYISIKHWFLHTCTIYLNGSSGGLTWILILFEFYTLPSSAIFWVCASWSEHIFTLFHASLVVIRGRQLKEKEDRKIQSHWHFEDVWMRALISETFAQAPQHGQLVHLGRRNQAS